MSSENRAADRNRLRSIIRTLRGVGGRGVGSFNTYNKGLVRPISEVSPPTPPPKGPYEFISHNLWLSGVGVSGLSVTQEPKAFR